MKDKIVFFDLDETLMLEKASAEESFISASGYAEERYRISPVKLSESVRRRARELWHKMPTYQYCRDIGISSWEGLWGNFSGEHEKLRELHLLAEEYRINSWRQALLDLDVDDEGCAIELSRRFAVERRKRHILFPEVLSVLSEIRNDYRLGLITNGAPDIQRDKIAGAGIESLFEHIIVSGEVNVGKPQREIFLIAIERFRANTMNCTMVGDSINRDIGGAKNAGIHSIWVNRYGQENGREIQPDYTIDNLLELPEILCKLYSHESRDASS
jgi:putative hydrolase of the HAD superfamily